MIRLSCIVTIIIVALICVFAEGHYCNRYDYLNVNEILKNDELREQYYKCFMDQAPCVTPDSKCFKETIGEAYHTNCKKCNERQKAMLNAMVNWYKQNQPDKLLNLVEKTRILLNND